MASAPVASLTTTMSFPSTKEARQPVTGPLALPVLEGGQVERREAEQLAADVDHEAFAFPVQPELPHVAFGINETRAGSWVRGLPSSTSIRAARSVAGS